MKNKRYIALFLSVLIMSVSLFLVVPKAGYSFFFVPTIEDLMEWFGVNRMDRSKDIKDNMLKSVELTTILPYIVFPGGDLTKMIGLGSLPQIPDIAKDFEGFQKELEELYDLPGSFLDGILGKSFPDSALGGILSRGNNMGKLADGINWKAFQEAPVANTGDKSKVKNETRIYKAVDEMIKKSWDESKSPSFKEFDSSMFEGASVAAYLGCLTMPNSHLKAGMMKGAAQYGQDIKEGRIKKIIELMAETDILVSRIKEKITKNENKITGNLGLSLSSFIEDDGGGAWKATASMYSSIAQQNIDNQMLIADLQALLRLRLRMKAQMASLMLYDYVDYCNNSLVLRNSSELQTESGNYMKGR